MRRVKLKLTAVLGALAALLAVPAGAGAASGTLAGTLRALPGAADFGVVEAVDPRGRIDGVDEVSPSGAFDLKLPPGPYMLAASGGTEGHPYESVTSVKDVDAGEKTKESPKLEPVPLPRAKGGKGLIPKGSILGVEGVLMTIDGSISLPIGSLILNDLYRTCTKKGMVFVDISPRFIEAATQEKNLSAAGKLSTPFDYRPLAPQYLLLGVVGVQPPERAGEPYKYNFELGLSTAAHLGVDEAATEVETTAPEYDFDVVRSLASQVSAQFAAKVCG
jgi:hypothetical protein